MGRLCWFVYFLAGSASFMTAKTTDNNLNRTGGEACMDRHV